MENSKVKECKNALYSSKCQPRIVKWPYLPTISKEYSGLLVISEGWSIQIDYYYKITLPMWSRGWPSISYLHAPWNLTFEQSLHGPSHRAQRSSLAARRKTQRSLHVAEPPSLARRFWSFSVTFAHLCTSFCKAGKGGKHLRKGLSLWLKVVPDLWFTFARISNLRQCLLGGGDPQQWTLNVLVAVEVLLCSYSVCICI